tara:strand:+ start:2148 stop:3488 length:1341 start_codon:yes stop_codon:yes gene_type:complete
MNLNFKVTKVFDDIYKAYNTYLEGKRRYRLIIAYGSSRSSKSVSIMQLFAILLLTRKNFKITVWRETRVTAVATVMEDFKKLLTSDPILGMEFVHNKKDASFVCKKTQSIIYFSGTDQTSKVLGMYQDISFFNEISEFTEEVYLQIAQRTQETIFSDYNPSGVTFLDKYSEKEDTIFMRSTYLDNPFLSEGIINQLEGYNPFEIGTTYVDKDGKRLMNEYNDLEVSSTNRPPPNINNIKNGTANEWLYMVYALGLKAEKPNKIYSNWSECSDEFYDKLELPIYCGLDFGISSPTAVVEVKFDGDRTFYIKEILYKPTSSMGITLGEFLQYKNPTNPNGLISPSTLLVCDSAKKIMVDDLAQDGLMAVSALKGAGSIARSISTVQSFNIVYTKSSKNIRDEYNMYSWKIDRYGMSEDLPDPKQEDHAMDSIKYVISYLVNYLPITYK